MTCNHKRVLIYYARGGCENESMRVLLVDPDLARAEVNCAYLRSEGVDVILASTGEDAAQMVGRRPPDLVVLSPSRSEMLDDDLVEALRTQMTDVLVLAASPKTKGSPSVSSAATTIPKLEKSGSGSKLLALIKVALRARHGLRPADLQICNVTLSLADRGVAVDGLPVALTPKEFAVLELLFLRRNTVLSKETLLDHLDGGDTNERQPATIVDVFICKIRRKLAQAGAQATIDTVWGRGYIVRAEDCDKKPIIPSPLEPSGLRLTRRTLLPA